MLAVIDPRMPCSAKASLNEICEVIELPPFSALDPRIASHPDMLIFRLGDKLFVCKSYYKEARDTIDKITVRSGFELVITDDVFEANYPNDIKFNAFTLCDYLVGKSDCISKEIKKQAFDMGIHVLNVNQGYAKCSAVVLDKAIITADGGIHSAVRTLGYESLLIHSGDVALDGYGCGFIGGASGVLGNKVYFCGDITAHQNSKEICDFCKMRGYEVISLSDESLYDVGTIIFL